MVGCAAVGCTNSTAKGFIMKVFPRDPALRKQWAVNVRRGNWTPTNNSYLCEVHFAPEMWELRRADDKRKLIYNAVPTIFSFTQPKPMRKPPKDRQLAPPTVSIEEPGPSAGQAEEMSEIGNLEIECIKTEVKLETICELLSTTPNTSEINSLATKKELLLKKLQAIIEGAETDEELEAVARFMNSIEPTLEAMRKSSKTDSIVTNNFAHNNNIDQ